MATMHKIQIIHNGITYESKWENEDEDLEDVKTSLKLAAKGEATFLEIENDKNDIHFFPSEVLKHSVLTIVIKDADEKESMEKFEQSEPMED
jgi:hypothetical protein